MSSCFFLLFAKTNNKSINGDCQVGVFLFFNLPHILPSMQFSKAYNIIANQLNAFHKIKKSA